MRWHQLFGIAVIVGSWQGYCRLPLVLWLLLMLDSETGIGLRAMAQPAIASTTSVLSDRGSDDVASSGSLVEDGSSEVVESTEVSCVELAPLPNPLGVAGPFAGPVGENFVVFGGANFPDAPPWLGGRKSWTDAAYLMKPGSSRWELVPGVLQPLGYGLSIPWNGELYCIGGCDSQHHSAKCYRIGWDGTKLTKASLPDLPKPSAYACGAMVGTRLFVAGGLVAPDAVSPMKSVWVLDLAQEPLGWIEIPSWPGPERMLAVAACFGGEFYIFSGVTLELLNGSTQPTRRYLTDAYCYSTQGVWRRIQDVPVSVAAAPGPAPAIELNDIDQIVVMGGDRGDQLNTAPTDHKGFSTSIMAYSPKLDRWDRLGELPFAHVTTSCSPWMGGVVVPSGEIRPGVRSPKVWLWRPPR